MTSKEVYELLCRIDEGYEPTAAENEKLAHLQKLEFSYTQITELPEAVGRLSNLQALFLSYTRITELPEAVGRLSNLQELYLRGTQITELPEAVGRLSNLQALYLRGTPITELPEAVGRLSNLQALDLSFTQITELPEAVGRLSNLQALGLSYTRITELPEAVGRLPKLEYLRLENLQLDSLPESLLTGPLPFYDDTEYEEHNWRGIFIGGTTIKNIPTSALLQSQEVRKRQFGSGIKRAMNEAKIIFLGDGEVGKSYTVKRILNGGKRETGDEYKTSTTHGVRIVDYRPRGKNLLVHLWDFGGQEIMHSMHRCFLTENTGYVVMVDTRKPGQTARARYWLQNVRSIAPHAPVILMLNLWDSRNAIGDLDDSKLIGQFGNDLDITVVKCSAMYADDEEFLELMGMIGDMAASVEKNMGQMAAEYIEIKDRLKKKYATRPYIPVEEFDKICREHNVRERESAGLLNWFNELGICFSYRDKEKKPLTGYNLLQPKWLTNAIYAIIMEGRAYAQRGKITRQAIYDFLKKPEPEKASGEPHTRIEPDMTYKKEECDYVIDVARSFNLVYEVDGTLFFPAMLENKTPKEIVENKSKPDMRYRLEYEFLPDTVIHQLMVECLRNSVKPDPCWLRGMRANAIDGLWAIVQMTEDNKTLEIDVYGEGETKAHTMFKTLRDLLNTINGRLNMKCTDFILAPDGERFEIARLETEKALGNTSIVGGSGKVYKLDDLTGTGLPIPEKRTVIPPVEPEQESEPKKDKDWVRNSEGWKNMFPYIALAVLLLFIGCVVAFNPPWAEKAVDIFSKMKGCGG